MEVSIIPKPNTDSIDKKNLEDLLSDTDKLRRSSKKIVSFRNDLKQNIAKESQNLTQGIKLSLKGLDEAIEQIEVIFGNEVWIDEIDKTLEKELSKLKVKLPELLESIREIDQVELKEKALDEVGIKSIIKSAKKTGLKARDKQSFDQAIQILQDVDKKLLPALEPYLPEDDRMAIKASILKELQTTLVKKGKIDEAIQVIDSCCEEEYDSKTYIESQIEKSFLLVKKGEFNQSVNLLKDTLKYDSSLPEAEIDLKQSAEIKRALAIAYRGRGAYKKALQWFGEAQKGFLETEDDVGYYNVLWGIGILRHLTGEWDEAIEIWKKLIIYLEKQPDDSTITKKLGKPPSLMCVNAYSEYARTLQLSGKLQEAEKILNKALMLAKESKHEYASWYYSYIHLLFSDLYYQQDEFERAAQAIAEARQFNKTLESKNTINEMKILQYEINVLLALDEAEEAKKIVSAQYDYCKSNWEKAAYYRLLGLIEKHEMNFGLAKTAFKSSLEIIKEIGASSLSDELLYIELLIEMSKTGNRKATNEAETLLIELEAEVKKKKISAFILECNLLKAHLARVQSNYDKAYQLYSEIIRDADTYHLYRQKRKALKGISLIEQEGQQLRASRAKELSVYRYLEDARRILEENS